MFVIEMVEIDSREVCYLDSNLICHKDITDLCKFEDYDDAFNVKVAFIEENPNLTNYFYINIEQY